MRIDNYVELVKQYPPIGGISEGAARPLISIQDEPIRDRAISLAENALNLKMPTGGKKFKTLTERDIRKIIDRAVLEVRNETTIEQKEQPEETPPPTQPQEEIPTTESKPEPTQEPAQEETVQETIVEPILEKKRISNNDKIKYLTDNILKPEHLKTLKAIVQAGEADDILDALYVILDNLQED